MNHWEDSKENMAPTRLGRNPDLSVSDLSHEHQELINQFEFDIADSTNEDSLASWTRYINWTKNTFPNRPEMLTSLLERVTDSLKDIKMYANDRRYIILWIQYADLCSDARDVFRYMRNKEIGLDLAIFWEAFALVCENYHDHSAIHEIFQEGISRGAHPVERLRRKYSEYQVRFPNVPQPTRRHPISSSSQPFSLQSSSNPAPFQVYEDDDSEKISFPKPDWRELGGARERNRENEGLKSRWTDVGPFPQKINTGKRESFKIFEDNPEGQKGDKKGSKSKKVNTEVLSFDLTQLYNSNGDEFSFEELRSMLPCYTISPATPVMESQDDDVAMSPALEKPPSPTINTKAALNDVLKMFSSPIISQDQNPKPNENQVNDWSNFNSHASEFDVFEDPAVTVNIKPPSSSKRKVLTQKSEVDHNQIQSHGVVRVTSKAEVDLQLKKSIEFLQNRPDFELVNESMPHFCIGQDFSISSRFLMIRAVLGSGIFATVYDVLVENEVENPADWEQDGIVAMKVGKDLSPLEYYVMVKLSDSLPINVLPKVLIPLHFTQFSCGGGALFSELHPHGTIQSMISRIRQGGEVLDETLILFFASEMLFVLEHLMKFRIMHCDIKPDNWLLSLSADNLRSYTWLADRSGGWDSYGLVLADFGSAIDHSFYHINSKFTGNVCASGFAHPKIEEGSPWGFEVDWFAAAGCIHVLLFGDYMALNQSNGNYFIKNTFKRYWQRELWKKVFDNLLNNQSDGLAVARELIDTELETRSKKIYPLLSRLVVRLLS
ncbi:hypothetical protein P9112_013007 [Eukaryota sp. TZLM1-RC]